MRKWRDAKQQQPRQSANFFSFTSNVDAHWHQAIPQTEIRECHGNSEHWQCSDRLCAERQAKVGDGSCVQDGRYRAPIAYRFKVNETTMLAPEGPPQTSSPTPVLGAPPPKALPPLLTWTCRRCQYGNNVELTCCDVCREPFPTDTGRKTIPSAYSTSTWNAAFETNHPTCVLCGGPARPAIMMFNDEAFCDDDVQSAAWMQVRWALQRLGRCT